MTQQSQNIQGPVCPIPLAHNDQVTIGHGSGGRLSRNLIEGLFLRKFNNAILRELSDSALLAVNKNRIAFTTDSYVVSPLFFPGSDIGKLAVFGTVNDLSVAGAKPLVISCALIIEEGLDRKALERIVDSIKGAAALCKVRVVTGDTKVVEKGACDKIFINTSGIGVVERGVNLGIKRIRPGDKIIISGTIGDHGITILTERRELKFRHNLRSDCNPLNGLISSILRYKSDIKFMRDPTRGGVATTLNEIASEIPFGIEIKENALPFKEQTRGISEILGLDPLYFPNEGMVLIVASPKTDKID